MEEKVFAYNLINAHNFGAGFRDKHDLEHAKLHSILNVAYAIRVLTQIEGTTEEKVKYLENVKNEIEKFHVKE